MELLNAVSKFWPVITGGIGFLLYLGALHQMIKNNNAAITRLFKDLAAVTAFTIRQEEKNVGFKDEFSRIHDIYQEHNKQAAERYGFLASSISTMNQRIDAFLNNIREIK